MEPGSDGLCSIDIDNREEWLKGQDNDEGRYHWEKWQSFVSEWKMYYTEHTDA